VSADGLPPRPPDATYSYTIDLAGAPIANSTVAIASRAGDIVVTENASSSMPHFTAATTTTYDAATLHVIGYRADFALPRGAQHTDVTMKPGAFTVTVPGQSVDIAADPSAPLELIGDNLCGTTALVPAVLHATGARTFTLAVLAGGKAIVATVVPGDAPERPAHVPASDAHLTLELAGLREIYWYDPVTFVVHEVDVPAQQASFTLTGTTSPGAAVATPAPPPSPLPLPFPHFSSRDVRFTSAGGAVLAGTITVPDRGRAPFPAVVLVHGSGPENRDEAIGPNPIFLQLANALSNAGYVVLRYDKRGVGESTGGEHGGTRDELLADVRAAVAFARARSAVDARRVFLLGHSEGGELVPSVAARDPRIAGIVLLAPPALPLWRISTEQTLAGVPPPDRAAARSDEAAALEKLRRSSDVRNAWYRSSMDVDPIVDIRRVRSPILILQGAGDAQVLPADLPRLVNAARATNRDVTVRTFAGDNHLFEAIVGPQPQTPAAALHQYLTVPARIDERVLHTLIAWLGRR
jgi:alpha-beta hydrolase superfamily lysophospholipase